MYAPWLTAFIHQMSGPMNDSPYTMPTIATVRLRDTRQPNQPGDPDHRGVGNANRVEAQSAKRAQDGRCRPGEARRSPA